MDSEDNMGRRAECTSLIDLMVLRATMQCNKRAFTFLSNGGQKVEHITYGQLGERAKALAKKLQLLNSYGGTALLLYPSSLEYISAFLGCLYAGVIAVPAFPPQPSRVKQSFSRLSGILKDAKPAAIMTNSWLTAAIQDLLSENNRTEIPVIATDMVDTALADSWSRPEITSETTAFLQYTSGSTRSPRGVMISHGNLLQNELVIRGAFEHDENSIVGGWLPLYHDMGLIGNVLQPLYCGFPCVLMSPQAFLQEPIRWLQVISEYRITTSGAPNFAYELCASKVAPSDREKLDLSCWNLAFNGAEPINPKTLDRFVEAFSPCGFRREAFYPCYGLAESTLFVSGGKRSAPPVIKYFQSTSLEQNQAVEVPLDHEGATGLVGCGQGFPGQRLLIVNLGTLNPCPDGTVGEIWLSSLNVAQGYWGRSKETTDTFRAGLSASDNVSYLRTGDLGFLWNSELFVTGRLKDLIIIRGRNHYPQDIEATVADSHVALRKGCGAAFSVMVRGEERLAIAQEVKRQYREFGLETIIKAIRTAVVNEHGTDTYAVILLKPGTIHKTSSGKIRRHFYRLNFPPSHSEVITLSINEDVSVNFRARELTPHALIKCPATERRMLLETYLLDQASELLKLPPGKLEGNAPLTAYGLDSLRAMELRNRIQLHLGVVLPMAHLLEATSLSELVSWMLHQFLRKNGHAEPDLPLTVDSQSGETPSLEATQIRGGEIKRLVSQTNASSTIEMKSGNNARRPVSFQQQGLWRLHQEREITSRAYNILSAVRFRGRLDHKLLEKSIVEIVQRHSPLRTTFSVENGELIQVIQSSIPFRLQLVTLPELASAERETEVRFLAAQDAQCPFDLRAGPVFRVKLYQLEEENHVLTLIFHHIACDGWSVGIVLEEITACYEAALSGKSFASSPLSLEYTDFARTQGERLTAEVLETQKSYWKQKLKGKLLDVIGDRLGRGSGSIASAQERFSFSESDVFRLKKLAQSSGATPFMVLLAVFKATLHAYSGLEDIIVGSSVAYRHWPEVKGIVGPFTNAITLRTSVDGKLPFAELLDRVRKTALEAYRNQDVPFEEVVREISLSPDAPGIFRVVMVFQNFSIPERNIDGLKIELEEFDSQMSNFDLALIFHEKAGTLRGTLNYKTSTFDKETIRHVVDLYCSVFREIIRNPDKRICDLEVIDKARTWKKENAGLTGDLQIAIAATFVADLLQEPIQFWMEVLGVPAKVEMAPYNQLFQQLLDPKSLLATNQRGINVVAIRIADLCPFSRRSGDHPAASATIENLRDFVSALKTGLKAAPVPFLVCICPSATPNRQEEEFYREGEWWLISQLQDAPRVHIITIDDVLRHYPVSELHDDYANAVGHVPFSLEFFTALGTIISRRLHALTASPFKVVVVDCDNTLWDGLCGEEGLGVTIGPRHKTLQTFLANRRKEGMLVCLSSKNEENDVALVFDSHPEMVLQREDITSWKVNWEAKSQNIRALARELNLSLDSFLFIDDNPLECAEVATHCPGVLTVQLPAEENHILRFLQNLWVFDRLNVTAEDQQRTTFYFQSKARDALREHLSFEEFLNALDLVVEVREIQPNEIARVSQLTQRTTQFNTCRNYRSEADLSRLLETGHYNCRILQARDRFGDYGLVGAAIYKEKHEVLHVDTFLLSCRALGRRIERKMLQDLGSIAAYRRLTWVEIPYIFSERSKPVLAFLEEIGLPYRNHSANGYCFRFPVQKLEEICLGQKSDPSPPIEEPVTGGFSWSGWRANHATIMRIAAELTEVRAIYEAIGLTRREEQTSDAAYAVPESPIQKTLAEIWMEILKIRRVSVHDNFFQKGGNSLLGTLLISRVAREYGVELPLHSLFEKPTIATMEALIQQELLKQLTPEQLMEAMSGLKRHKKGDKGYSTQALELPKIPT
jgi:FkbH-like protein